MLTFADIQRALKGYQDVQGGRNFFAALGYPTMDPLPSPEADQLPPRARQLVDSMHILADCRPPQLFDAPTGSQFRIYHVELKTDRLRRTDFRIILDPFYRRFPQGNNLFVFTTSLKPYRELAFVSPQRLLQRRPTDDRERLAVRLRTLRVIPTEPYYTDLEILQAISLPTSDLPPEFIWQKHESAFNIERVTERFFEDYRTALYQLMDALKPTKPEPEEAAKLRSHRFAFAQLLLNRLMVCYFLARKGWLRDDKGNPIRRYFRWLWGQYRQNANEVGRGFAFYDRWLANLFFLAFNNQQGAVLSAPLPESVRRSFQQMPFLNGGLFAQLEPDTFGYTVPDHAFANLLFGEDPDRDPKLLERYNFTVDESRPYDEEVAVDPEMLGKVYESLIAEEERGKAGIFYTPRLEVDLMCRLSLVEFLHERLKLNRDDLLRFVFLPNELATDCPFSPAQLKAIERTLKEVKIVDPAVGSGSFLVGMLNVLCELLDSLAFRLERKRYDRYDLKRHLILHNLYGVDVKDWAVRACELRLFLSLLVELPDGQVPKGDKPILPNLDFRIRIGDSLVQEVPEIPVPFILRRQTSIATPLQRHLQELVEQKRALENTPPAQLSTKEKQILDRERQAIATLLEYACRSVERQIQRLSDTLPSAPSRQRKQVNQQLENLKKLLQRLHRQQMRLRKGEPIPLFLWEVMFPEVFFADDTDQTGFDIVIANPPYVRQEKIAPPTDLSPRDYKSAIQRNIQALWDKSVDVPGRADLYVPFFFTGLSLLKPGGVLCLITSNAWLDVDYGKAVQAFLLRHSRWLMTIDNLAKRTFAESDINTVITLAVRPAPNESVWDNTVRFVAFRVPFEDLTPDLMAIAMLEIYEAADRTQKPEYRVTPKSQRELWLEGATGAETDQQGLELGDPTTLPYTGNKLGGKYLRAPEIYFTILEKGKDKLVRLGDIAEVRFGIKTGANDFFYLEPIGMTVAQVTQLAAQNPKAPVRVRNGAGWVGEIEAGFLKPMLFSLKEAPSVRPDPRLFRFCAFVCRLSETQLRRDGFTLALAYIHWGAKQRVKLKHGGETTLPQVPSLRNRDFWYALPEQQPPDFISNRFVGERFVFLQGGDFLVCDVFFVGYLRTPDDRTVISALLNSTSTALVADILARKTYGIGVAYLYGPEISGLLIPHPSSLTPSQRERLLFAFEQMASRKVKSIFEELGFQLCRQRRCEHPEHPYEFVDPQALTLDQVLPDRRALDEVVFEVLGLTEEEQEEVYRAVVQLVKDRLRKAKSR